MARLFILGENMTTKIIVASAKFPITFGALKNFIGQVEKHGVATDETKINIVRRYKNDYPNDWDSVLEITMEIPE